MLVPWSWLRQWVAVDCTPEDLGDRLAFVGLEVEAVQTGEAAWDHIVVGEIQSIEQHPNADRLVVCEVDTGDSEPRQIVCGATNMQAGDHVPVALPGAQLGDIKIKKSTLRGVTSQGMMCSARELGLGEDHAGLLILDRDTAVGTPASEVLGGGDTVLELSITPNRGDCLSMRGLAREVAILSGKPMTPPDITVDETGPDINTLTSVTLDDAEGCPRYTCRVIQGITVGPSPQWLADAVTACGMRPINNVVDATNYVMLELGQPLHAFDMHKLTERRIVVRRAHDGEQMTTLDEETRTLHDEMTAICDAGRIVAVGGVMGGLDSGVTDATTDLLLESAYFEPTRLRRTERDLKLSSESSYRFARGVDIDTVPVALDRLAQIIHEVAGGTIATGMIDAYPAPHTPPMIAFRLAQIERVLGLAVEAKTVRAQLESLGCTVAGKGKTLEVTVPSWRSDLTREIDLIEEVARLTGYDKVPTTLPRATFDVADTPATQATPEDRVRDALVGAGFTEVIPYRFGPDDAATLGLDPDCAARDAVHIVNPLSEDRAVMRLSPVPGMVRVAGANQRRGNADLGLFEVGTVFHKGRDAPVEDPLVTGVLTGRRVRGGWWGPDRAADVYDAKGALELVLASLNLPAPTWHEAQEPYLKSGAQATAKVGDTVVGWVGELKPEVLETFEAQAPMFAFLVRLNEVAPMAPDRIGYTPFSRYPPVRRVRTYDVPEATLAAELTAALAEAGGVLLEGAELTDVYRGENLPAGMKSLTVSLTFRAPDRTLTDKDVDGAMRRLDKATAARCGATVREG